LSKGPNNDYNYDSNLMTPPRPFDLIYDAEVVQHLAAIERRLHRMIRRTIEEQLRFEPESETRNRKPLFRPSVSGTTWELRFGPQNPFRVFYRTDVPAHAVHVLAVGVKAGNRLWIGTEEFEL
jgi:hypothetical protein